MRCVVAVLAVVATSVQVTGVAAAAGLVGPMARLGAGSASVTACGDLTAASPRYTVTAGTITGLTLTDLPAGCVDSQLSATLTTNGIAAASAGPVTVTATSVTFPSLTATPTAGSVTDVRLVAVGR
jgi:phage tail protein X